MATTTNYSWTTPDDTALVKDGAAAIRSLGTAIDTTVFNNAGAAIVKTIVDAKGDIIAATAADTVARLAVGTNGQVLTVDSTEATGLKYATPAAYNPDFTLINAGGTALSGASTTVSGISGKTNLFLRIDGVSGASTITVLIRFNSDSGSNYYLAANNDGSVSAQTDIRAIPIAASDNGDIFLALNGTNATGIKPFTFSAVRNSDGFSVNANGYYAGTSAITSVTILTDGANFDAGTVYVYGA